MARTLRIHAPQLKRDTWRLLIAAALVAAVYVFYLEWQDRRAERFLENLRREDPVRYLDDLRRSEGFDSYLAKYRLLEGYATANPAAPTFLVGRWTLRAAPQRVPTGTVFADCRDPITFEQGLVEVLKSGARLPYEADYRITGSDVYLHGPVLGVMRVAVISYGGAIDHLELVPPGSGALRYAYLCGQ